MAFKSNTDMNNANKFIVSAKSSMDQVIKNLNPAINEKPKWELSNPNICIRYIQNAYLT